jgi:hypothetical protein
MKTIEIMYENWVNIFHAERKRKNEEENEAKFTAQKLVVPLRILILSVMN